MATLGDLKARIISETNRDDLGAGEALEDALTEAINEAIDFYAGEPFWFTHTGTTTPTVTSQDYVARPAALRIVETVSYNDAPLLKVALSSIEFRDDNSGQPSHWADNGANIQLWPIPDAVYSLDLFGEAETAAPTLDAGTGIWVNEARHLIAARAKFTLYRDTFRDVEGAKLAAQAEGEALTRLRRETRRRNTVPLRATADSPWHGRSFNIMTG